MDKELEIIARRKGELEAKYAQLQAQGQDTSKLEQEARQLLNYEQALLNSQNAGWQPGQAPTLPAAPTNMPRHEDVATILCCNCGVLTEVNDSRLCLNCLEEQAGIVDDIAETNSVNFCKGCERYEAKPRWLKCEWESKELLALCLKRVRKPKHLRLVNAEFVWTESHSRRIKVLITVEGEVEKNVTIRQQKEVTFVVGHKMCEECTKSVTPHVWVSNVQIRQRSEFKRSMLFLEQLILKHHAHQEASNVVDTPDGLDFHFLRPQQASAFVQFIKGIICCKVYPIACQLIGHDCKSNIHRHKYVQIVELCPVNRGDLVYIPKKISQQYLGGCANIMICDRLSSGIRFLDPLTLQVVDLDAEKYFKLSGAGFAANSSSGGAGGYQSGTGIRSLINSTARNLHDFVVLNTQKVTDRAHVPGARTANRGELIELELCKCSDLGKNERYITTISHLGGLIKPGDIVTGYDLTCTNLPDNDAEINSVIEKYPYEVIVVKKQTSKKKRDWEFQNLPRDIVNRPAVAEADQQAIADEIDELAAELSNAKI